MAVRTVTRRGARRLVIDIAFRHPDGTKGRYRHDAEVQTLAAARAEERRRLAALAATGSPYERPPGIDAAAPPTSSPAPLVTSSAPKAEEPTLPAFAEVVKRYRAEFAPTRLKPSTARNYGKVLDGFLVPRLGGLPINRIDADVVRRLDLEYVRRNARSSTRRNVQTVLRSVLCRFAVEAGLLEEPPRMPRLPPIGKKIVSALTKENVEKLLEVASKEQRLAFLLAAYAGLRAGEVRGLRARDVDLRAGHLIVRQSICHGEAAAPKSGHERIVPLLPRLHEAIEEAIQGRDRDATVSTSVRGRVWGEFALNKAFLAACRKAGLEGWRFHDLRHYFVTSLFRGGAAAPVVQRLAGHEHLITTERYAHVASSDLADAMKRLALAG